MDCKWKIYDPHKCGVFLKKIFVIKLLQRCGRKLRHVCHVYMTIRKPQIQLRNFLFVFINLPSWIDNSADVSAHTSCFGRREEWRSNLKWGMRKGVVLTLPQPATTTVWKFSPTRMLFCCKGLTYWKLKIKDKILSPVLTRINWITLLYTAPF